MQALAASIRVQGMPVENMQQTTEGNKLPYVQDDFEYVAKEMDSLIQGVSHD